MNPKWAWTHTHWVATWRAPVDGRDGSTNLSVFDINGGVIKPLLTNVKHVVAVTTMGAPWWFAWYMGHPGRMFLSRGVRAICAKGCRFTWLAHDRMDSSTPESRAAFLAKVRRTFAEF